MAKSSAGIVACSVNKMFAGIVALALMLGLFGYTLIPRISASGIFTSKLQEDSSSSGRARRYGVVLDAGSSGTRALLYSFDPQRPLSTIRQEWMHKSEPGLSSCAIDEASLVSCASDRIATLLTLVAKPAREGMQQGGHGSNSSLLNETRVVLRATAGLRLLNADVAKRILEGAAQAINSSAFARCEGNGRSSSVRVSSGSEEARNDWLTVNVALRSTIGSQSLPERAMQDVSSAARTLYIRGSSAARTLGVLDMGGASTQIAFAPAPASLSSPGQGPRGTTATMDVHLSADVVHRVYGVSRLHYGLNEAYEEMLRKSLQKRLVRTSRIADQLRREERGRMEHPCMLRGTSETVVLSVTERTSGVFTANKASVEGRGNFEQCLAAVSEWLRHAENEGLSGLSPFTQTPALTPGMPFILLDNFLYMIGALWGGLNASTLATIPRAGRVNGAPPIAAAPALPTPSLEQISERARDFCRRPWSDVYAALDARMKARYSSKKACFTAAYTVALLHDVYGFDLQSERTPIVFSDTLNGFEGSWALGAWVAATIEKIST